MSMLRNPLSPQPAAGRPPRSRIVLLKHTDKGRSDAAGDAAAVGGRVGGGGRCLRARPRGPVPGRPIGTRRLPSPLSLSPYTHVELCCAAGACGGGAGGVDPIRAASTHLRPPTPCGRRLPSAQSVRGCTQDTGTLVPTLFAASAGAARGARRPMRPRCNGLSVSALCGGCRARTRAPTVWFARTLAAVAHTHIRTVLHAVASLCFFEFVLVPPGT